MKEYCILKKTDSLGNCDGECNRCGWNSQVAKERRAYLKLHGLSLCSDGLRRLIIVRDNEDD